MVTPSGLRYPVGIVGAGLIGLAVARQLAEDQVSRLARSAAFRRLARRNWRAGVHEMHGSLSRRAYLAEARSYLPWLQPGDVMPAPAGVRAQAVDADDFRINRIGPVTTVRNAPSPAATASLAIAEHIVAGFRSRLAQEGSHSRVHR